MGLPWPEWGETDVALNGALHYLDSMSCPCGCGHTMDVAHDESTEGRWQVKVATCYAGAALGEFRRAHQKDGVEPGTLTYTVLLAPGETPDDPLAFDPAKAAEEHRRHMESLGLSG